MKTLCNFSDRAKQRYVEILTIWSNWQSQTDIAFPKCLTSSRNVDRYRLPVRASAIMTHTSVQLCRLHIPSCIFACFQIGPGRNNGTIGAFTLILHGTAQMPEYRRNGPRIYNEDYNRIRKTVSSSRSIIRKYILSFEFALIHPRRYLSVSVQRDRADRIEFGTGRIRSRFIVAGD